MRIWTAGTTKKKSGWRAVYTIIACGDRLGRGGEAKFFRLVSHRSSWSSMVGHGGCFVSKVVGDGHRI